MKTSLLNRKPSVVLRWFLFILPIAICFCLLLKHLIEWDSNKPFFGVVSFDVRSDGNGSAIVFSPATDELSLRPVILFLNGVGENGSDGFQQIINNFGQDIWRRRGSTPFLIVCPQCRINGDWTQDGADGSAALEILEQAIERFRGDPDRVLITGPSSGGAGSLALASAYPNRFSGVVAVSTSYQGDAERLGASGMPIWIFYNSGDRSLQRNQMQLNIEKWNANGLCPLVSELPGTDHNAWDAAYAPPAIYSWFLSLPPTSQRLGSPFRKVSSIGAVPGEREIANLPYTYDSEVCLSLWVDKASDLRLEFEGGIVRGAEGSSNFIEIRLSEIGVARGISSEAQSSLRTGWNDLRLKGLGGCAELSLNGWHACKVIECLTPTEIRHITVTGGGRVKPMLGSVYTRTERIQPEKGYTVSSCDMRIENTDQLRILKRSHRREKTFSWRIDRDSRFANFGAECLRPVDAALLVHDDNTVSMVLPVPSVERDVLGESVFNDEPRLLRQEFRARLLAQDLENPLPLPVFKYREFRMPLTSSFNIRGSQGGLDDTNVIAPLLAFTPKHYISQKDWRHKEDSNLQGEKFATVLRRKSVRQNCFEEVWLSPCETTSVLRWIERDETRVHRQIDYRHLNGDSESKVMGWTALVTHPCGQVLDFQVVSVADHDEAQE